MTGDGETVSCRGIPRGVDGGVVVGSEGWGKLGSVSVGSLECGFLEVGVVSPDEGEPVLFEAERVCICSRAAGMRLHEERVFKKM